MTRCTKKWSHSVLLTETIFSHYQHQFEHISQARYEQTVVFLNCNPMAMKLGIFRHPFHPEEKWLLRKWNTSCTNPNHEMKETEKGETTWVGESPSYFLRAQPVQSKDERVGCYRVTIQVESRVTVLGQKRRASVFNTHRSFPGKILTCKIISAE